MPVCFQLLLIKCQPWDLWPGGRAAGHSSSVLYLRRPHWPLELLHGVRRAPPTGTEPGLSWEVGKGTECRPSCCHRDPQVGPSPLEGAWVPLPERAFPGGDTSGSGLGALPWSPNGAGQLDGERGPPSPPPSVHTEKRAGRGRGSRAGGEAAYRRAARTAATPETSGQNRGKSKIMKLGKRKELLGHQGS